MELTWSKDGVSTVEADYLSHLLHDDGLHEDEDGSDLVGEHVGVGRGSEPLTRHRDQVQPAGQLVEEVRVTCEPRGSSLPHKTKFSCSQI